MTENMMERVDPELGGPLEAILNLMGGGVDLHDIPATRLAMAERSAARMKQLPMIDGVTATDYMAPGSKGCPDVPVRVYQPDDRPKMLPALLWIHGGGYVGGSVEGDDYSERQVTLETKCVNVSVDYRLAPENPFPAPLEDCYDALKWLVSNAGQLGVDKGRVAIGGASAGGGLAASLARLARDRGELKIAFQLLIYPMVDDRNVLPATETLCDHLVWTRECNLIGWQSYLGRDASRRGVSPYAAPFRARNLVGLPPAYVAVGDLDLFLNEDVIYAQRLAKARVPTELHVYPRAFHGFNTFVPAASVSRRFNEDFCLALKRALHS